MASGDDKLANVPAGKLIKIDCAIWDLRNQLQKDPHDTAIRDKIDELVKEREAIIQLIASDGTEPKVRVSSPPQHSKP